MNKQDYVDMLERRLVLRTIDRRQFIRSVLATGVTLSGAMLLADRAEAATPVKGGVLTAGLGHGATTDTLDPGLFAAGFLIPMGLAMNGYLTEIDANSDVQPSLAESWEASDGATVWTFKLRKGVEFHNGKTLTAEDVVASINHHRDGNSKSAAAPLVAGIKDIRVDGDDVVVFELNSGNADFPAAMSDYHIAIMQAEEGKMNWQSGVGCGAYRLDEFNPGVSAKLTRHANHWTDAAGHVDEWNLLAVLDTNARMTAALSGSVDVADKVDVKTAARMSKHPAITVHSVAGTQHYTFPMLTNRKPFDDNNIRQAIKWGIDREELVKKVLLGYGAVGNDHPIGSRQKYFNSDLEQKSFDPDKAKYFLKQAGLDTLDVELSTSEAAFSGAVDAALLMQNSLAKCGINVKVAREPKDGYWTDVWMKKNWSASYWAGRPVEDLMFSLAFKSGVSWNESYWSNDRFDALLQDARAELDQAKRRQMYWEMQDLVANQGGVAVPMFASYVFATRPSVGVPAVMGSNLDLDGSSFMQRWWKAA